jgi:hypothetical protein
MDPGAYLEATVRDVLTADEPVLDDRIGYAALLLASAGATAEADRLVTHWHALTERPVDALVTSHVRARAWAMLFEARGERPDWAAALLPLDLDAEERAHTASLTRPVSDFEGVLPPGVVAEIAGRIAPSRPDRVRTALADGDLARWAGLAGPHPDVATLAATRSLAPRLVAGADPLGLREWAEQCTSALVAALYERYPRDFGGWPDLIAGILRLRGDTTTPGQATAADVAAAERRLGVRLPADYREFLLTCDGLPADVVFPRLLGAAELRAAGGAVVLSEPAVLLLAGTRVVEADPVFGTTTYDTFRALLEHHLTLLAQSA